MCYTHRLILKLDRLIIVHYNKPIVSELIL